MRLLVRPTEEVEDEQEEEEEEEEGEVKCGDRKRRTKVRTSLKFCKQVDLNRLTRLIIKKLSSSNKDYQGSCSSNRRDVDNKKRTLVISSHFVASLQQTRNIKYFNSIYTSQIEGHHQEAPASLSAATTTTRTVSSVRAGKSLSITDSDFYCNQFVLFGASRKFRRKARLFSAVQQQQQQQQQLLRDIC